MSNTALNPHDAEEALRRPLGAVYDAMEQVGSTSDGTPRREAALTDLVDAYEAALEAALELLGVPHE